MRTRRLFQIAAVALMFGIATVSANAGLIGYGIYEGNGDLYTVDLADGTTTRVGSTGFEAAGALAYNPLDGFLYGIIRANGELIRIDPATAASTSVGLLGIPVPGPGFGIDAAGNAYVSSRGGPLYSVNLSDGATTLVGNTSAHKDGLAFIGSTLYAASASDGRLMTIDTATGATSVVGNFDFVSQNFGAGLGSDGTTLWFTYGSAGNVNHIRQLDPATGLTIGAPIDLAGLRFTNLEVVDVETVPEPSAAMYFGIGLGMVLLARWRKKE